MPKRSLQPLPNALPASARALLRRRAAMVLMAIVLLVGALLQTVASDAGNALFDLWQRLAPRERQSAPVVIISLDEASLQRYGAWPWPRSLTARLLGQIAEFDPAVVGVDLLFADDDPLAPQRVAQLIDGLSPTAAQALATLPDGDAALAKVLAAAPFVLGRAGVTTDPVPAGGFMLPMRVTGQPDLSGLKTFPGLLRSVAVIEAAAPAQGLVSASIDAGMVRRMPMLFSVGDNTLPALSTAMLALVQGVPALSLTGAGADSLRQLGLGQLSLPVDSNGHAWLRFSRHEPSRFVSAADLLDGKVPRDALEHKLVLVGFAAHGLQDTVATPVGERMPGVELHAQLLENVFDGELLRRPAGARWLEWLLAIAAAGLVVLATPVLSPLRAWALALALLAGALAASFFALQGGIMIDVLPALLTLMLSFGVTLGLSLAQAQQQRRLLDAELARQREAALLQEGEFDAARRVQLGMLPDAGALPADARFDLAAKMVAAHQVGGDLYDFFRVGEHHLVFLIGDVSGKGLAASIFMALSKALCKSLALRGGASACPLPGELLTQANAEIGRDNPEMLFVTALAGLLDLNSGALVWSRAGHDVPYLLPGDGSALQQLDPAGGPPLCVVDEQQFDDVRRQLQPGDTLVISTDGILEAQDSAGRFYGRTGLEASLARARSANSVAAMVDLVLADTLAFTGDAEPADDATLLVLRWNGVNAG